MTTIIKSPSRIAIFFLYDPHGIADNSVLYFLEQARPFFTKLLVVVNGKLIDKSKDNLNRIVDEVLVRENKGYDVWACKAAIDHLGWKQIEQYDELTLFNYTNFGPLYPLNEMFEVMDSKNLDFWGITKYHENQPLSKPIPEHIQSHWISIRKSMFSTQIYKDYWCNIPQINSYNDAIFKHEVLFTNFFSSKGFKWEVYINIKNNDIPYQLIYNPLELIRDYRCPILKKRCFFNSYNYTLLYNSGEELPKAFEYIKNNLNYNIDYIWENILRLNNIADIKNNLGLNYILSSKKSFKNENIQNQKIALVIHIFFSDLIEYCFLYSKSIPETADVYITTDSEKKKQLILKKFKELKCNKLKIIIIENRGRDVSSLLVGCKEFLLDYDLVCFAHDKKTAQINPSSSGRSFSYRCWENILMNKNFVNNIIETFVTNTKLGLLFSPPPYHNPFSPNKWGKNFELVKTLAKKLNINISIEEYKQPIAPIGTIFWFRPSALKKLIEHNWDYNDFPPEPIEFDGTILHAIERLYSYVAQNEGYYPAWSMSENFAKMEIESLSWLYTDSKQAMVVKSSFKFFTSSCARYLYYYWPKTFRIIAPIYIFTKKTFKIIYKFLTKS